MIWSSASVPVPVIKVGPAASIASSSDGHPQPPAIDLHSAFVKTIHLDSEPSDALIDIFAYTRYRLYINGIYQGRGPSRFQNQRPEYDTRHLRNVLRRGANTIAILVHRDAPTGRIMHHEPGLAAILRVKRGSASHTIPTDTTWFAAPDLAYGPRDEAWASIEEHIDARRSKDWTNPDFASAGWPTAIRVGGPDFFPIWPRTTPLQTEIRRSWSRVGRTLPTELHAGDELTFELPEIVQAYHSLSFEAEEGSELSVTYMLPQGETVGTTTYISRSGPQTYLGGDTFAQKQMLLRVRSGRIQLTQADAVEVRYPFERAASFHCSDELLNRLWNICARSLEVLSEDSYVDCADRERVEWTDDSPPAFDCTRVMMRGPDDGKTTHWADARLLCALLRRISLTQLPDGQLKAHSCSERFDIHAVMEDRSCDWVILLREYYESTGDRELVRELWPTLTRLMKWYLDRRTSRGLVLAREWEVWDNPLRYQVCEGTGLNALTYRALVDAAYLGNAIGEVADSKRLAAAAGELKTNVNSLLWNAGEGTYDGALFGPGSELRTQLNGRIFPGPIVDGRYHPTAQAALFALYCGIVPSDRITSVQGWVLNHLAEITGPMSHYYLFQAMYRIHSEAMDTQALLLMRNGWKAQVDSPWQTTWEALTDEGGSKVHIYGMVPGSFLTMYALGVRRVGPTADRNLLIEPRSGDLSHASGVAVTEFGPVQMQWSKDASGALSIACDVPQNVKAMLRLYARSGSDVLTLNADQRKVKASGGFVELQLSPGRNQIRYPS